MKWNSFWRVLPFLIIAYIAVDYFVLSSTRHIGESVVVGLIMGMILIILRIILDMIKKWQEE